MAQPSFVPVPDADKVRPSFPSPVPTKAREGRPGVQRLPRAHEGPGAGTTGPDQGYALTLAHRLAPRLHLVAGEDRHDAECGLALLAARRAALMGRAPCIYDLDAAAELFGFTEDAPSDLVAHRRTLFSGIAHSYSAQRALADAVPDDALVAGPGTFEISAWRSTLGA